MNNSDIWGAFDLTPKAKPSPSEKVHKNMLKWRNSADIPLAQFADMLNALGGDYAAEAVRIKVDGQSKKHWRFTARGDQLTVTTRTYFWHEVMRDPTTGEIGVGWPWEKCNAAQEAGAPFEKLGKMRQWFNDRGLITSVCKALGLPTVEEEKEAKRLKRRRDENRKTCPVCFRDICIDSADNDVGVMVNHGYERPGCGYIVGNCFAVKYQPYEVSCQGTKDFLVAVVIPEIENTEQALKHLLTRPPLIIVRRRESITLKDGDPGYDNELRGKISSTEYHLKNVKADKAFLDDKVVTWKKVA